MGGVEGLWEWTSVGELMGDVRVEALRSLMVVR